MTDLTISADDLSARYRLGQCEPYSNPARRPDTRLYASVAPLAFSVPTC